MSEPKETDKVTIAEWKLQGLCQECGGERTYQLANVDLETLTVDGSSLGILRNVVTFCFDCSCVRNVHND